MIYSKVCYIKKSKFYRVSAFVVIKINLQCNSLSKVFLLESPPEKMIRNLLRIVVNRIQVKKNDE